MAVVPGFRSEWHAFAYDTVLVPVATAMPNPVQFFTLALGQGTSPTVGSGAKLVQDTNLTEPQKLPNTAPDMWVRTVRFIVSGLTTPNDFHRLNKNYVLTILVNNSTYLQGPLDLFPAGGGGFAAGLMSTAQLATSTPTFGMLNGFPSCSSTLQLTRPIPIGQGETFRAELNGTTFTTDAAGGTTLGQGLFMRVVLEGEEAMAANQR
jgi:hypothetical protein